MYSKTTNTEFGKKTKNKIRIHKIFIIQLGYNKYVLSILQYGCTTWTLTKQREKKLDGNYTRMPPAILNKSWSLFFSFFFLLWSGSGTSRKVVSALNLRVDVTSRLITVSMCFLGSLLSSLTRFTEIQSFYLFPPAPNSSLQNPSHFGATASHWLL